MEECVCDFMYFVPTKGGGYCDNCGASFMNGVGQIPSPREEKNSLDNTNQSL